MISNTTYPSATKYFKFILDLAFIFKYKNNTNNINISQKLQVWVYLLIIQTIYHHILHIAGIGHSNFPAIILYEGKRGDRRCLYEERYTKYGSTFVGIMRTKIRKINTQYNKIILILFQHLTKYYHKMILLWIQGIKRQ